MTQEQFNAAALLYCQMTGINPQDQVPDPKDPSKTVAKLDVIKEVIGNQLLIAYCVEQTLNPSTK